ncbi:ketoacyl-synt-domain-containing protein [Sphaerulina musiva SO2202]|uniref:Ketoacyl-synt-domain-containing protein n=1 Tax=Sphaerulina musiva (strain SO2202) TaxID=692275 RepID=M3CY75_SPHMS|nr:ketoacyl-synt-domain-containing protein [Sphaerulina musiva SO2202]EMF09017.1 ketoacyl-synt-domain-containing protein [Sphaerulina musiva SO2202]
MSNILLFGDQTAEQYPLLHKVTLHRDNVLVSNFVQRSALALREETRALPRSQRDAMPDFLTLTSLVEAYYQKGEKVPMLESALVTIAQLGHYIGYFSEHPDELPATSNTRVLGLCTGLLAAAAVVSARTIDELVLLGVDFVRVAFRSGAAVDGIRSVLAQPGQEKTPWSAIVTGTTQEDAKLALSAFHEEKGIPLSNQAYISAVSVMAITISGPPTTLERFFKESALSENNRVAIPIYGPYHAPHLFHEADLERILSGNVGLELKQHVPSALVHSAATGKPLVAENSFELAKTALREMLQSPVRWDYLLEEVVSQMAASRLPAKIYALGVSNIANSLVTALKAGGKTEVSVIDQSAFTESTEYNGRTQNDKIAIVGMAGRFPNSANHEALWDLLMKGLDVHRKVPADRFDADAHCDPSGKGKNKSHTPFGCFIDEPGLFDPRFFNMSPREAAQTDPMGRLALVTAYEALEMSGYVPNRTTSTKLNRIGTFYGQTSDDWREINAAENVDTYFITGGVRAFAPGRINYYFKFSGPSYSIDTACSSSLAAIQLACTSLWAGDCDTACAGGLNVLTNPDIFSGLSKGQFLSKTGSCKTYDNDADGYCRGDACGTVILKRYQDAVADKDNILGCILGAATNHSAEAVSITHPHAGAQEFLYKQVLANAGVDAHEISYVEMHGTGTQAGDGIEMTSVTNVFAPRHRQRRPDQTVHLGAIKANVGHAEAASGVNSLVKVLMMMKNNKIPANVGIKGVMNKTFPADLKDRNVHISQQQVDWPRKTAAPRRVFLNNFSAAGGNTALLIEDGPLREAPKAVDPRSTLPITISARSIASLKRNLSHYQQFVRENAGTTLTSFSYTTTARRIQHNYRVAFSLADASKLVDSLQGQVKDTYSPVPMVATKVAFCFTGQGSQYTGLGQKLYQDLKSFRDDIDQLDQLARIQGLPSFLELLDGTDVQTLSPVKVQLGMACIQVALARMWASWGITPSAVVGHSLGEYAALHVAGVISASDMVLLVGRRAELLVRDCTPHTHGMLAVKGSADAIRTALGPKMTEIACINGPEETVLCGSGDVVGTANEILARCGFKATKLNVPFAFHSAQVDPILEQFTKVASAVTFNKPVVPVLSPLEGQVIRDDGIINPTYLARHAREPVNFWSALISGQSATVFSEKTAWLEIGAHPVCSGMVKASIGATVTAPSLRRGEDAWKTISNSICQLYTAGVNINFDEFHREFNDAQELLTLPTYSFDNKKYWLDYHNNWTLTKGEAAQIKEVIREKEVAAPAPVVEVPAKRLSTSCQKVISEEFSETSAKVVIRSSLADNKLYPVVCGHLVNNAALCPSSLYADMALTVSDYIWKETHPESETPGLNVCNMEVPKPLIAQIPQPAQGQHVEMEAVADLENNTVKVNFRSVQPDGKKIQDHAHCIVRYEDKAAWAGEWARYNFMVNAQIDTLTAKTMTGGAHKVQRGMAYKLFKALVTYDSRYRAMSEVVLDGKTTEASATIDFPTKPDDGDFYCSPYHIDGSCHISGFIVNASDLLDSEQNVYVSHGWSAVKISKPLTAGMRLRNYVRMLPQPNNISKGDVYILEGDEIVAVCEGIKFQQIPRRVLNTFLPPNKGSAAPQAQRSIAPKPAARPLLTRSPLPAPVKVAPAPVRKTAPPPPAAVAAPASRSVSKPKKVAPPKKPSGGLVDKIMQILAKETEVDVAELVDDAHFENLGVDSLLSLTISAIFREELDIEISSSLFTDYPSVGEMKKYFAGLDASSSGSNSSSSSSAPDYDEDSDSDSNPATDVPTPLEDISTPASSAPSIMGKPAPDSPTRDSLAEVGDVSIARHVVAQEMGVDIEEITDDADLSELGMDSLMSLTILGELREKTNVDLPSTFLSTNPTMADIENALGMRPAPKTAAAPRSAAKTSTQTDMNEVSARLGAINKTDISRYPAATSVLLQGNAKIATKKVFFLPDGSGSATSYVSIPNLGPDVAAYGLNCPFMKNPDTWDCGIEVASLIYLAEIKRRQAKGPYIIGGWSAGGVIAYAVAQALLAAGEKVEKLLLLDSPCPVNLDPLPARLHIFFNEIGLLGTGDPSKTPKWLLPHFSAAIRSLSAYDPKPTLRPIPTYAVWCKEGVAGNPGDPRPPPAEDEDPAPMKWLLNHRTDFGDNGWAQLCTGPFKNGVMNGHHFSMMKEPHAKELGKLIREGLDWRP